MNRVFILGAGASHFAGYPLSPDLWAFIRDKVSAEVAAHRKAQEVIAAMDRILHAIPPKEYDRPNLEELFTFLDLAELGTEPLVLSKIDWPMLRLYVMDMISEAFLWHEYEFQKKIGARTTDTAVTVLEKWADLLRNGDTIITFNWDILHEAGLYRSGKWHYADGYGFACPEAGGHSHSPIQILKLHGSVNWAQRDEYDTKPAIEDTATFFGSAVEHNEVPRKSAGQANQGRNLIVPSYVKDITSNRLFLHLWNQASDALTNATEITVIGFQLHPADAPARQLIGSALLRNSSIDHVTLVSPSGGDNWDEFCLKVGKTRKLIQKTFENWVLEYQSSGAITSKAIPESKPTH
jgi:hypothetical protein